MLSLDVDGSTLPAVGERDPIVGDLQQRYRGLRPVLFPTPYEAACWSVLSQRTRMTSSAAVRRSAAASLVSGSALNPEWRYRCATVAICA